MTPTTLVIDGDVLLWRVAVVSQDNIDFGDGPIHVPDKKRAKARITSLVNKWKYQTRASGAVVALSVVPDGEGRRQGVYWRHQLLPDYKMHRPDKESKQPPLLLFDYVRGEIQKQFDTYIFPDLEADDVMGVIATDPEYDFLGDRVILSIDKDMQQVPAKLFNPAHPDRGIIDVDPDDADRWHYYQALVGDITDNYRGCPGIGPAKANKLLDAADAEDNGKSRSFNRWMYTALAFKSKGFTEDEAITQLRVARILRHGEWSKTDGVKLWTPPTE